MSTIHQDAELSGVISRTVHETLRQLAASPLPITSPWLDRHAAAAYLGIHPEALDKFVRRGEIRSSSHGRIRRFNVADLDSWLQAGCTGGAK